MGLHLAIIKSTSMYSKQTIHLPFKKCTIRITFSLCHTKSISSKLFVYSITRKSQQTNKGKDKCYAKSNKKMLEKMLVQDIQIREQEL